MLSSRYNKHRNKLSSHSSNSLNSLYSSKCPPPKALYLKAILPLSNRLSNLLHNHRYSNQLVLSSLTVKKPLLLSNRYSRHHNSNSHISLCNNK